MSGEPNIENTLKGCPFCDGVSYLDKEDLYNGTNVWRVQCPNCLVTTPWYAFAQDVADRWNQRVAHG